jgi:hypothetical protein
MQSISSSQRRKTFDNEEEIFFKGIYIMGWCMGMPPPSGRISELSFCIAT